MPIEFPCPSCGSLLRTPDGTSGKSAKCPSCQQMTVIPEVPKRATPPGAGSVPPPSPDDQPPVYPSPSPYAATSQPAPPNQFAEPNPYQSPLPVSAGQVVIARSEAKSKVMGPAIGLIVSSAVCILVQIANIVSVFAGNGMQDGLQGMNDQAERVGFFVGAGLVLIVPSLLYPFMVWGAVQMLSLRRFGISMATCILSFMPCNLCCMIGIPFGIWGLVVLMDVNVRPHFDSPDGEFTNPYSSSPK